MNEFLSVFLTSQGLYAVGTALAGLLVFALAAHLPSVFPPAFARLVGFVAVGASLAPVWVLAESWRQPAALGGVCLAAMAVVHVLQTRRRAPARGAQEEGAPSLSGAAETKEPRKVSKYV